MRDAVRRPSLAPLFFRFMLLPVSSSLLLLSAGCDDDESDAESGRVLSIMEQRCASGACHGVTAEAAASQQLDDARWLTFRVDGRGAITDPDAALASMRTKVNSAEDPVFSTLLRKTLSVAQGGLHHHRGAVFQSREDPDYQALAAWAAKVDGTEGADVPALDPLETRFVETVYPTLIQKGCVTATCHGELNFGVTLFKAPAVGGTLKTPRADLRATYIDTRRNLSLWGDPLQSRLIAKMLPLEFGGMPHKGGNDLFFATQVEQGLDPRNAAEVNAIVEWVKAERAAALGDVSATAGEARALVFVGGPLPDAGPFDVAPFTPGTDLYRLDAPFVGQAPVNLTARHHDGPADVRDPAVSHDGRRIVFTMRTSEADAHNLYTMDLEGGDLRPLTHDASATDSGLVVGNFGPVFGPNGGVDRPGTDERIYFSSTRAGDRSDDARFQNADLYAIDVDGSHLERLTYTVVPEVAPTFLTSGEFAGSVAFTIKRAVEGGFKGVFFRFPIDHDAAHHLQPEAHPHFGMSEPPEVFYRLREMPDGRAALVLLDEGNRWRGGQLAMLERQFAVEVPEGDEASATLPGFRHALTILGADVTRAGSSVGGLWRDPSPLPDGTLLAARAAGMIDLSDAAAAPSPALVRVTLEEDRASNRPRIKGVETLFADAALPVSQPVAVYPRPAEDPPHARAWTDGDEPATLVHSGVQVIEAVLSRLAPVAARVVRDDLVYVRAMVPLAVAGALEVTPVPASETRDGHPHATNLSITGHMPLFAALEVPVAPDGSLAALIPAKVPVRVVTLDADRVATGTLQHQWYAALPGERFPVGIPESSFAARCAGCHGSMDGRPESVLQPPTDFVTQASVTQALYDGADRRKPLALPVIDASFFVIVDFRADVQPILDARCATSGCHVGEAPAGGLSLTSAPTAHYTDAYESLLALGDGSAGGFKYVDAAGHRARGSYLAEKIMGREYEAPHAFARPCPPEGPPLNEEERLTLLRWIEFGATFVGVPPAP